MTIACTQADRSPLPPISADELASRLGVPVDSLLAAGEALYSREAYDSAQLVFRVAAAGASSVGDGAAEARARMWSGMTAWRLGDYEDARSEGEASIALKRRHDLDAELSRSYNAMGLLAWNEGRLHEAQTWLDSALAAAERHADEAGVARAWSNIPLVQTQLGDYDGARAGFRIAIDSGRRLGNQQLEANSLANLAMLEVRVGNPRAALDQLGVARGVYAQLGYATGEANALGQEATAWGALGDLQRAIAAAQTGLEIARDRALPQEVAAILEVMADLYAQSGDLRRALATLAEADGIDARLGLEVERGTNLRRQGAILLELGDLEVAVQRARAALDVHVGTADLPEQVLDRLLLAEVLSKLGDRTGAQKAVEAARASAARLGDEMRRLVELTAARLALAEGDPRSAIRALDALPRGADSSDWQALDLRAAAELGIGDLDGAREAAIHAVAALELERGSLDLGPLRAGYLQSRLGPIARLIDIQLRSGDTIAAFETAAAVPGRGLAEQLAATEELSEPAAAQAVEAEKTLRRIAALSEDLRALGSGPEESESREAIQTAIQRSRVEYERLAIFLGRSRGAEYLSLVRPTFALAAAQLPPDAVLFLPFVGPDRIDVFTVVGDRVTHHVVPLAEGEVANRVRLARSELLPPTAGADVPESLRDLGRRLLGPIEVGGTLTRVRRMWVVAHGPLSDLPFAALWLPGEQRFLVERVSVAHLPTVGALGARSSSAGARNARRELFAPLVDSLPATEREVRAIAALHPDSEVRLGRSATEGAVRVALSAGADVHIASHGALDSRNPMFSMMQLSRGRSAGPEQPSDDGRLEAHEVMGMRVRSALVFLSGCETGLGTSAESRVGGDHEGSLAQALLHAGAGAVVATLWRVEDARAADMAERFYGSLGATDPIEALAVMQRAEIREGGSWTWAAYTVTDAPNS